MDISYTYMAYITRQLLNTSGWPHGNLILWGGGHTVGCYCNGQKFGDNFKRPMSDIAVWGIACLLYSPPTKLNNTKSQIKSVKRYDPPKNDHFASPGP